jgi:hypothetical protein
MDSSDKSLFLRGLYYALSGFERFLQGIATGQFLAVVTATIPATVVIAYLLGATKSFFLGMTTAGVLFALVGLTLIARYALLSVARDDFIKSHFPPLLDLAQYQNEVLESDIPVLIYIYDDRFSHLNPEMDESVIKAGIKELGKTKFLKLNLNNNEWFKQTDVGVEGDPFKGGGTGTIPGFILKLDRASSLEIPVDERGFRLDWFFPIGGIAMYPDFDLQTFINDSITFLKEEGRRPRKRQRNAPTDGPPPPLSQMN